MRTTLRVIRESLSPLIRRQHAVAASTPSRSTEWENAKPYEEIPGPKSLPILGNWWRFLPVIGDIGSLKPDEFENQLTEKYGKIFKLDGIPGRNPVVFVSDPELAEKVFRNEGPYPERHAAEAVLYYRNVTRRDKFDGLAGAMSQGKDWYYYRSKVNSAMMRPKNVQMYVTPIDEVACDFITRMRDLRDDKDELPSDFIEHLSKWALESISLVALDTRLGCLDPDLPHNSQAQRMINAVHEMFDCLTYFESLPPYWKFISTPKWKRFVKAFDTVTDYCIERAQIAIERIKNRTVEEKGEMSIIEQILLKNDDPRIAYMLAADMLTGGIDTTVHGVATVLSFLAKYQDKQEILFKELKSILPDGKNQTVTSQNLEDMKYLKAFIKEVMRIKPVAAAGLRRILLDDFVLASYRIPRGTDVATLHSKMCLSEENYTNPKEFVPERWLKNEDAISESRKTNPFVFLPFGFGPRMCLGRRFAELEIQMLTAKVIRNFTIDYKYGDIKYERGVINNVVSPLKFKITERTS